MAGVAMRRLDKDEEEDEERRQMSELIGNVGAPTGGAFGLRRLGQRLQRQHVRARGLFGGGGGAAGRREERVRHALAAQDVLERHLAVVHEHCGLEEVEVHLNVAVRLLTHQLPRGRALRAVRVEHARRHKHACTSGEHDQQ